MRFPSLVTLAERAWEVLVRFPWTIAAGTLAAIAAIVATTGSGHDEWARVAMVIALALPLTVALTLYAEERGWSAARSAALNAGGGALLGLFYLAWPGPDLKYEAIRYFQLSVTLHLLVAVLPFAGQRETRAFWQYNHRLFLGILRSVVFSAVLFLGLAIALGALDQLFGVDVPGRLYGRLWIVIVFVANTWIFLADVPRGLRQLVDDTSYPKVLKVFAQYILTPLVFIYLILLLAYLIKIVVAGEWPSGWIGWLVSSVAVAGLLGFLLVHPLRDDVREGWIRTYTRWLFVGLIPAAIMLLVAFWKRVLPYGLTEPRLLGVLLGLWLLAIALSYTLQPKAGIRRIPVSLAALLLLTLYGPQSVTRLSVNSQGRRLAHLVAARPGQATAQAQRPDREASAALMFLLEHGAQRQIAAAIPGKLPPVDWDSVRNHRDQQEKAAGQILAVAGLSFLSERASYRGDYLYLYARRETLTPVTGYDWLMSLTENDKTPIVAGRDTVALHFDDGSGVLQVLVGGDSLVFDLRGLALSLASDPAAGREMPAERMRLEASGQSRRAMLWLESLSGRRGADSVRVQRWAGKLFLGKANLGQTTRGGPRVLEGKQGRRTAPARNDSAGALGAGEHPHLLERQLQVPARYRSLGQRRHVPGFQLECGPALDLDPNFALEHQEDLGLRQHPGQRSGIRVRREAGKPGPYASRVAEHVLLGAAADLRVGSPSVRRCAGHEHPRVDFHRDSSLDTKDGHSPTRPWPFNGPRISCDDSSARALSNVPLN
jgi:hypothetical protein